MQGRKREAADFEVKANTHFWGLKHSQKRLRTMPNRKIQSRNKTEMETVVGLLVVVGMHI